jgi:uncharacterized membrane protein
MGNQAGLGELLRGLVSLGGGALSYNEPFIVYLDAIARGVGRLLAGATMPGYDYWSPSRVIPYTINEFPLWTFLFADLHPHLIAMPFGMLGVGIALNWVLGAGSWKLKAGGWKLETGSWKLGSLSPCFLVSLLPRFLVSLFPRFLVSSFPRFLVSLFPCLLSYSSSSSSAPSAR